MTCPADIAAVILEIIETGLLRARASGWDGLVVRCAVEADLLHNLPRLLADYRPELLLYYWDVERTAYIGDTSPEGLAEWEPLWQRLEPHVVATRRRTRLP
jgi:hypothetical protein